MRFSIPLACCLAAAVAAAAASGCSTAAARRRAGSYTAPKRGLPPPEFARTPGMEARVDARVDLMCIAMHLTEWGRYNYSVREDSPYLHELEARPGGLLALAKHPVVRILERAARKAFYFDAPYGFILSHSSLPDLLPFGPVPENVAARGESASIREPLASALADFARTIDFDGLWRRDAARRELTEKALGAVAVELDPVLRAYVGKMPHLVIIAAPLLEAEGAKAHGAQVTTYSAVTVAYALLSAWNRGEPWRKEVIRPVTAHEFLHAVVNPLDLRYAREIDALKAALFVPVREELYGSPYGSWRTIVDEHVIRAIVARLEASFAGPTAGARVVARERAGGFLYVPTIYDALAEYEADRARWPTLADFYPTLIERLAKGEGRPPDLVFPGPIAAALRARWAPTTKVFVDGDRALRDYVRAELKAEALTKLGSRGADPLTSKTPMRLYGTPRWTPIGKLLAEADILIEREAVTVRGKRIEGEDLRVVFVWPNPLDPSLPVVVYAAFAEEALVGVHDVPVGENDVVVARGKDVLLGVTAP